MKFDNACYVEGGREKCRCGLLMMICKRNAGREAMFLRGRSVLLWCFWRATLRSGLRVNRLFGKMMGSVFIT